MDDMVDDRWESLKGFEVSSGEKDFVGVVRVREAEAEA